MYSVKEIFHTLQGEGMQAGIGKQWPELEDIDVEPCRAIEVVDVERGLEHTVELWHGGAPG